MSAVKHIVVEDAGYEGEHDLASFPTRRAAERWMELEYSPREIEMLRIDICMEANGKRTYDPCGFDDIAD